MRILGKKHKSGSSGVRRTTFRSIAGDITSVGTGAIVNAANSDLRAGGGVCGAIFAAAGRRQLQEACDEHGRCPAGSAVVTASFGLEPHGTTHIIHAVGPVYDCKNTSQCDEQLVSAYRSALRSAESVGVRTVAIPAISTGIFGFPAERAAPLVAELLSTETFDLDEIILMALEPHKVKLYADALVAVGLNR